MCGVDTNTENPLLGLVIEKYSQVLVSAPRENVSVKKDSQG